MFENVDFANPAIVVISILLGIVVLVLGRRLFWLTIGGVGFVFGLVLAFSFLGEQPEWIILAGALLAGAVGAILAILLQKVAVGVAGFLLGGYALVWIVLQLLELDVGRWEWIIFVVGAVAGSIIVSALFDWALIALSSLVGAIMIVQVTDFSPLVTAVLFLALLGFGFVAQSKAMEQQARAS